jgi:pilus assembly protein Flp/PilA
VNLVEGFIATLLALAYGANDDEQGQTLIEYGLIIALVSIVAIIALATVGGGISGIFTSIAGKLHS